MKNVTPLFRAGARDACPESLLNFLCTRPLLIIQARQAQQLYQRTIFISKSRVQFIDAVAPPVFANLHQPPCQKKSGYRFVFCLLMMHCEVPSAGCELLSLDERNGRFMIMRSRTKTYLSINEIHTSVSAALER